ncbi:MAG: hypothetical protein NZM43_09955 [Saprospiraceae bacterium]|nr:hypothetical protein [Saprospiraceae bacterium]MDW8484637.1 hypothetical protein [Saprospiraceae bacterium]
MREPLEAWRPNRSAHAEKSAGPHFAAPIRLAIDEQADEAQAWNKLLGINTTEEDTPSSGQA